MQIHFQKHMAHLEASKPAVEAAREVLKETITLNQMTAEQKAALSPVEMIQLRRLAQQEMFAARKAGKLR